MSPTFLRTAGLLIISNSFMTFAWYAHLRNLSDQEMVRRRHPELGDRVLRVHVHGTSKSDWLDGNVAGATEDSAGVITLTVFVPFALLYMRQPLRLDFLWAALCILAAVFFMFRSHGVS